MASSVEPEVGAVADKTLFWARILTECNQILGPTPRRVSLWERIFKSILPFWVYTDGIHRMVNKRWSVLTRGTIVWGHIVQANVSLFEPGAGPAPADVLFSPYPSTKVNPEYLSHIAGQLFEMKSDVPSTEQDADFYRHMRNDMDRARGIACPVPNDHGLMVSTVLVQREDLPCGFLVFPYFPLAVLPDGFISIVPRRYWPEAFVGIWSENQKKQPFWNLLSNSMPAIITGIFMLIITINVVAVMAYGIHFLTSSR